MLAPAAPYTLAPLPDSPRGHCPEVRPARRYLKATHESVGALLDTFNLVRNTAINAKGSAKGRLSQDLVDLLRACIVFTSAGIDAVCQRLVHDSVGKLIAAGGPAAERFDGYLRGELHAPKPTEELVQAITSSEPRAALVGVYRKARTKGSFQGSSDLHDRVAKLLGIPDNVLPKGRFGELDPFFKARNDIVHGLDYQDINGTGTARHHRSPDWVIAQCDVGLRLLADLIQATADLTRQGRPPPDAGSG